MIRERRSSNFPKGTFKARTSKQGSFLNFLSSASACAKIGVIRDVFSQAEGSILLRAVVSATYPEVLVIPNGFIVRKLLLGLPAALP